MPPTTASIVPGSGTHLCFFGEKPIPYEKSSMCGSKKNPKNELLKNELPLFNGLPTPFAPLVSATNARPVP